MVRYQSSFTSFKGIDYIIQIVDMLHTGSVSTFICSGKGFSLSYQSSDSEKLFSPLLTSECTIFAKSQNAAFDAFLNDIYEASENRFFVKILKNGNLFWCGNLLVDVSGMKDQGYPQDVTLKAVDGLSLLKGFDFTSTDFNTPNIGTITAKHLFYNILERLRTFQTANLWSSTDPFFAHNFNWKDINHTTGVDYLDNTRIQHKSFHEWSGENNNIFNPYNCYEVLTHLCTNLGGRLALINGIWEFRQLNEYTATSSNLWTYQTDKTLINSQTANSTVIEGVDVKRLATQGFEFLPALKSVKQCFTHNTTGNLLAGMTVELSNPMQSIGTVSAGNGGHLLFKGRLRISFTGNTSPPAFFVVRIRFVFKIGSYFLIRDANSRTESDDYTNITWNNAPSTSRRFEFVTEVMEGTTGSTRYDFEIQTPDIVQTGLLQLDLQKVSVLDTQTGNSLATNINIDAELSNTFLEYASNSDAQNERCFIVQNGANAQEFSEVSELDNSTFGDAVVPMTPRALEVYNGTSWVQSSGWTVGGTGTNVAFTELLVIEHMAAQRKNVMLRTGTFISLTSVFLVNQMISINHHLGTSTENRFFLAMRASLNASKDEWNGTWWNIKTDRTTLIAVSNDFITIDTLSNDTKFDPHPPERGNSIDISGLETSQQ